MILDIFLSLFLFFGTSYKYTEKFSTNQCKTCFHPQKGRTEQPAEPLSKADHKPSERAFMQHEAGGTANGVIQPEIARRKG